jgi:hypothetical protein
MILFLDTEFTDFVQCELISIALVSECGRHGFYAERSDFDMRLCNEFVREAVLPQLGKPLDVPGGRLNTEGLKAALGRWLEQIHSLDAGSLVLVLYDYKTDFDLLADALDGELPPWLEGHNVSTYLGWVGGGYGIERGLSAHHALEDARDLRRDWLATRAAEVQ